MALNFDLNEITFEQQSYSFLKIGAKAKENNLSLQDFQNSKYKKIDELWGTLGWANDNHLSVSGEINFSENGNFEHLGATAEITELLNAQNVEINGAAEIKERFIDLSSITFHNVPSEIEKEDDLQLRFDLFLEKHEGALVYLQENPEGDVHSKDAEIHLITPESTDKSYSQNRYSLSYRFTYSFNKKLVYKNEKVYLTDKTEEDEFPANFTLKVLTFKRSESDLKKFTEKASKNLNIWTNLATNAAHAGLNKVGERKYGFFKFVNSANGGTFQEVTSTGIDPNKKTLLLLHGTFSSVEGSFGELLDPVFSIRGHNTSLLEHFIESDTFEQIIAFNHPTASHSIQENADWLLDMLGDVVFTQPIDIITTSRGVLIAELLTAYDRAYRIFKVNRVLSFAPAHGSDLLKVVKGIDRLLSLLKKVISKTGWGYVLALAQFSVNAIRTQPGLEVMMPDSQQLKRILALNPIEVVRFKSMIGDYNGSLIDKRLVRWLANGLDALLWLAFKSQNDWVIGCPEQRRQLSGPNARYESNFEYNCIHGKQFDPLHPTIGGVPADVRKEIAAFLK